MKLTAMSNEVYEYVKANGTVSVEDIATATGRTPRSINANITDLVKKGLALRDKQPGEGEDAKDITYVSLTDAGIEFVPSDDED